MTEAEGSPLLKGSTERTVFISYSWSSEEHRQWVLELAKRFRGHGIDARLDQWDLRPGQDKYAFMERMVTDSSVKKVVIICDRRYQEKADKREGGVGDETLLITPEVYGRVDQEKFIPVVVERSENGKAYMPAYLASRMYIDMSLPAQFDEKYQELLRALYDNRQETRPPLGAPPEFIAGQVPSLPKAASVVTATRVGRAVTPEQATTDLITDFLEAFLSDLEGFQFKQVPDEPYDETMTKLIERMGPLKDAFVRFVKRLSRAELSEADLDLLHDYLERIAQFQFPGPGVSYFDLRDQDNYRFICYELVLYLTASFIEHGKYAEIATLIDSTYFYDSATKHLSYTGIGLFENYLLSLDDVRNRRLGLRRVSVTADMIKDRTAAGTGIRFDDLVSADLLLHYLTFIRADETASSWQSGVWFPRLSPYAHYEESISVLQRLVSTRQFERVKVLFRVDTPSELRQAVERAMEGKSSYYDSVSIIEFSIPRLDHAVPLDRLTSVR
jgi:hypothetical protein